jgi:hypothetical protein
LYDQTNGGSPYGATATEGSTQKMETHGGSNVLKPYIPEARQNNLTKIVRKISQSRSIPSWQVEDATGDVETFGHVGG